MLAACLQELTNHIKEGLSGFRDQSVAGQCSCVIKILLFKVLIKFQVSHDQTVNGLNKSQKHFSNK